MVFFLGKEQRRTDYNVRSALMFAFAFVDRGESENDEREKLMEEEQRKREERTERKDTFTFAHTVCKLLVLLQETVLHFHSCVIVCPVLHLFSFSPLSDSFSFRF